MFDLPKIPEWDGLHPLIIHFPIALLLIVPILIVIGLIFKEKAKCFYIASLILMLIGTISTFIAVSTGEAAGMLALRTPEINDVMSQHESLAENTRNVFTILSILYLSYILIPIFTKKEIKQNLNVILNIVFLVIYTFCILLIVQTAHLGGRLVHELGVRGMM